MQVRSPEWVLEVQGQGPEWVLAVQAPDPLLGQGPEWGRIVLSVGGIRSQSGLWRRLVRNGCGGGGESCAALAVLGLGGTFHPVGRGTTRNSGSVSTPGRGGSCRPKRGCGSRSRLTAGLRAGGKGLGPGVQTSRVGSGFWVWILGSRPVF